MRRAKLIQHGLQVGIAAEEGQVITGSFCKLARHQRGNRGQREVTMGVAGGEVADGLHMQLLGTEGLFHVDPGRFFRQARQVGVIVRRAQGGGKKRAAVGIFETGRQERRWHGVADAQRRHRLAVVFIAADIKQRVCAKGLGQPAEQHGIQVEVQQLGSIASRLLAQVVGEGADSFLQGHDEQVGGCGVNLIRHLLIPLQLPPVPADALQRCLHDARCNPPYGFKTQLIEFGGVHAAGAFNRVVGFVHQ